MEKYSERLNSIDLQVQTLKAWLTKFPVDDINCLSCLRAEFSMNSSHYAHLNTTEQQEGRGQIGLRHCALCSVQEMQFRSFLKCGRCRSTVYCSRACQKTDWKVHRKICCPPECLVPEHVSTHLDEILNQHMSAEGT